MTPACSFSTLQSWRYESRRTSSIKISISSRRQVRARLGSRKMAFCILGRQIWIGSMRGLIALSGRRRTPREEMRGRDSNLEKGRRGKLKGNDYSSLLIFNQSISQTLMLDQVQQANAEPRLAQLAFMNEPLSRMQAKEPRSRLVCKKGIGQQTRKQARWKPQIPPRMHKPQVLNHLPSLRWGCGALRLMLRAQLQSLLVLLNKEGYKLSNIINTDHPPAKTKPECKEWEGCSWGWVAFRVVHCVLWGDKGLLIIIGNIGGRWVMKMVRINEEKVSQNDILRVCREEGGVGSARSLPL